MTSLIFFWMLGSLNLPLCSGMTWYILSVDVQIFMWISRVCMNTQQQCYVDVLGGHCWYPCIYPAWCRRKMDTFMMSLRLAFFLTVITDPCSYMKEKMTLVIESVNYSYMLYLGICSTYVMATFLGVYHFVVFYPWTFTREDLFYVSSYNTCSVDNLAWSRLSWYFTGSFLGTFTLFYQLLDNFHALFLSHEVSVEKNKIWWVYIIMGEIFTFYLYNLCIDGRSTY